MAKDFDIYCERNLMVKDKETGQIVPLSSVINWEQRQLITRVLDDLAHGRPVRYIILKARKVGISTIIEALAYWWTTTHRYVTSVIMAHEVGASNVLYEMFRTYYDFSHPHFQPDRKYNTKKDLVFDVEDQVKEQYKAEGRKPPGLGSQIKTLVAAPGRGRGDTPRFFHGSEVAFWDKTADTVSGALQGVPLAPETFQFLESTANGVGGYFYDEWQLAKKGESSFQPLFFAWHQHAGYELPGTIDAYDEEERELLKIFADANYPVESWDRKLTWRRAKKREFRSNPKEFYQEYPSTDMEAFLSSGRPVFDTATLLKMEQHALNQPKPKFGQVIPNSDLSAKEKFLFEGIPALFEGQDPTPLKVWELPLKEETYTIAVDVSEGKSIESSDNKENDYSVADVQRVTPDGLNKTVARWRGHIDPDLLGDVVYALGMFYNTALVGVEINNQGLVTVQSLRNKFYHNLYMRETSEENLFQERTSKMGFRTDKKTKPKIIQNLVTAIREGDIVDTDVVFIRECLTYVRDDQGFTNAQVGTFDDTVIAKAINLELAEYQALNQTYAKDHIQKPIKRFIHGETSTSLQSPHGTSRRSSASSAIERRRRARAARRTRVH
jgi:hypothetical protein